MPKSHRPVIYKHSGPKATETVYEFTSPNGGGHIELTPTSDGGLIVDLTNLDDTVTVRAPQANLHQRPGTEPKPIRVDSRAELIELARTLGVRHDWHEPDEQDVTATVAGTHLDNAGHWPADAHGDPGIELHVVLTQDTDDGPRRYAVNLATLLAWATGYDD